MLLKITLTPKQIGQLKIFKTAIEAAPGQYSTIGQVWWEDKGDGNLLSDVAVELRVALVTRVCHTAIATILRQPGTFFDPVPDTEKQTEEPTP